MSPFAMLTSLFAVVTLALATVVQAGGQQPVLGRTCAPVYNNATEAFYDLIYYIYPTYKFNSKCLKIECSGLQFSPCPYAEGNSGPYDPEAVKKILTTFTSCLRSHAFLCATPVKKIPICDTGVTVAALLNNSAYPGVIQFTPGSGSVSGIQQAKFGFNVTSGEMTVEVTIVYNGEFQGLFCNASFKGLLGTVTTKASLVLVVDPTNKANPVQYVSGAADTSAKFHIKGPKPDAYVQQLIALLNHGPEAGTEGLSFVGLFYGTMLQHAFDIALTNCNAKP